MMMTDEDMKVCWELLRLRHTRPPKDPNKQYPYQLIPFDDLRPGRRSAFIVDGVIPCTGIVAVWGPPKSGKSFWTFDLSMHIACGWKYRGRRVERGPVVYLAFEGADGFNNRAEAFRRSHEITDRPWFYLLGSNAKLVRDHKALIESIRGQTNAPPTVIVLDTLNRSIDGSESKDIDMGAYLAAAETICEEFDCVVIIVHHCGIDGSRPRGHTSLTGAAAAQIAVKRDAEGHIVAEVEAMKDGAEGAKFVSALKLVEVGTDVNDQPITSCAIIPVEGEAAPCKREPKLSPKAQAALRALKDILFDKGKPAPSTYTEGDRPHIPNQVPCVTLDDWREYLARCNLINREGSYREEFKRLHVTLTNAQKIGVFEGFVWCVT
jgi:hypothetical protein